MRKIKGITHDASHTVGSNRALRTRTSNSPVSFDDWLYAAAYMLLQRQMRAKWSRSHA